jgi:AraC-like DNA-binding protein
MDVLTDLLTRSRARGAAFARTHARGDWGIAFPAVPGPTLHTVLEGQVALWTGNPGDALALRPGDVVLVRQQTEQHLGHIPGASCVPIEDLAAGSPDRQIMLERPGSPASAAFFCGAYLFEGDLSGGLLSSLPTTLRLQPAAGSSLRATTDLIARELLQDEPGQQTMLDRLLDVALVQILREHFTTNQHTAPAWFRASSDPHLGPALRAVHANPGHAWTVAELAAHASLSRAAFARRFNHELGVAPLTYLTDWRMALARERLRDSNDGIAAIAQSLAYASEFSFAAAFKRHEGIAPGRWRNHARAAGQRHHSTTSRASSELGATRRGPGSGEGA